MRDNSSKVSFLDPEPSLNLWTLNLMPLYGLFGIIHFRPLNIWLQSCSLTKRWKEKEMCLLLLLSRPKICNKYAIWVYNSVWTDLADFESGAFIGKTSTNLDFLLVIVASELKKLINMKVRKGLFCLKNAFLGSK